MSTDVQAPRAPTPTGTRHRLPFVDWARGAAYVLMVTAHVAPNDGPARILLVSEFITAPLYAMLIGLGTQLGRDAALEKGARYGPRAIIRALLVLGLSVLLARSEAQVHVVLAHLALLMALCLPLARLGTRALSVAGLAALTLALLVPMAHRAVITSAMGRGDMEALDSPLVHGLALVGGTGPYRATEFLLCAIVGMLAIRVLRAAPPRAWLRGAAAALLTFTGMLALIVAPNVLGLYGVHAGDGTPSEQIGIVLGALGVLLTMWTLQHSPLGQSLPEWLVRMLAAPGQAGITLYSLHILVLHVYQVQNPHERDDHWWMLALLVILGAGFAIAWQAALRPLARKVPALRAWVTGPFEGLIRVVQTLVLPRGSAR